MLRQLNRHLRRLRRAVRGTRPGREGFSLVEIMIVLMILSVGVIPIAVVQHQARREVAEADRYTEAMNIAQAQLERVKGMGFGNVVAENGVQGSFAWQVQVVNVAFGLDRLDVTVTWNTSNTAETMTVSNLVSMR